MRKLICFFKGHAWDKVHGFNDDPDFDAICSRCRLRSMTYTEWLERNHS